MRLLRLAFFFLLVSALVSIPASGQSSSSQQTPNATTSQAPQAQQSPQPDQPPSGDFGRNPFAQRTAGSSAGPELKRNPGLRIQVPQSRRRIIIRGTGPPPNIFSDPGIYLRKSDLLGNACGSIVSYNFSTGDNPRLESITTCTPAGIVKSRRAGDDEQKKPPAPALIRTGNRK